MVERPIATEGANFHIDDRSARKEVISSNVFYIWNTIIKLQTRYPRQSRMKFSLSALHLAFVLLAPFSYACAQQIQTRPDGVETTIDGTHLRVLFITDRIVRVTASPNPHWR